MPDLLHSLLKQDLGHLRIIASLWGLELESSDVDSARDELSASLLDVDLVTELIDSLSPQARAALNALIDSDGRIPWANFTREYGNVREMGPGKRDRVSPHLNPESTAEALFYRGLLARAFFDTEKGPQEFAYIPDDLLKFIPVGAQYIAPQQNHESLGRDASPGEKAHIIPATDHILDDITTLLAALRLGHEVSPNPKFFALLNATGLTRKNVTQAEKIKAFLEAPRAEALNMLVTHWKKSDSFNELRLIPELVCEGAWKNQPLVTREFLLDLLSAIPENKWWSLVAFVRAVKQKFADFQRPASDYDSWFIKRKSDGEYLRGFDSWDEVDGALVRFLITDVMFSLGLVDLAKAKPEGEFTAFRITPPDSRKSNNENGKLHVSSQGKITAPHLTPRAVRYQLARFCEWDDEKVDEYRYRVTPKSLTKAKEQGLKVEHLLALLAKHSDSGIPPVFVKALKRWEVNGTEARAETQVVLKVSKPEVLEELRKSKASKYLGEPLGPTTVVVKGDAIQKVIEVMTELGLLAEDLTHEEK